MMIKAIETLYKGYRFRSRLEARWAVLWDAYREPWLFEREGYATPFGPYLPDFWLPRLGLLVEVKGRPPTELELKKLEYVCSHTGWAGFVAGEDPLQPGLVFADRNNGSTDGFVGLAGGGYTGAFVESTMGSSRGGPGEVLVCADRSTPGYEYFPPESLFFEVAGADDEEVFYNARTGELYSHFGLPRCAAERGVQAFRSARFEHGETPR